MSGGVKGPNSPQTDYHSEDVRETHPKREVARTSESLARSGQYDTESLSLPKMGLSERSVTATEQENPVDKKFFDYFLTQFQVDLREFSDDRFSKMIENLNFHRFFGFQYQRDTEFLDLFIPYLIEHSNEPQYHEQIMFFLTDFMQIQDQEEASKVETFKHQLLSHLLSNFKVKLQESSTYTDTLSTLLDSATLYNSEYLPDDLKIQFMEISIPYIISHPIETDVYDHLLASCCINLDKMKNDETLKAQALNLIQMIDMDFSRRSETTHAHVLNSLEDVKNSPTYTHFDQVKIAIGEDQLWRLIIDGEKQYNPDDPDSGVAGYEKREKGSVERLINGYRYALSEDLTQPVTIPFIQSIHKAAASRAVEKHASAGHWAKKLRECVNAGFYKPSNNTGLQYKTKSSSFSALGIIENVLKTDTLLQPPTSYFTISGLGSSKFTAPTTDQDDTIQNSMQILIDAYERKMQALPVTDRYERLKTIVQFIHIAELNHPFQDGNCRTLCTCLLNRELMRFGFSPTLQWNPNYFDALSTEEIMLEVLEGMKDFQTLATTKTYAREISAEELAEFRKKKAEELTGALTSNQLSINEKIELYLPLKPEEKIALKIPEVTNVLKQCFQSDIPIQNKIELFRSLPPAYPLVLRALFKTAIIDFLKSPTNTIDEKKLVYKSLQPDEQKLFPDYQGFEESI